MGPMESLFGIVAIKACAAVVLALMAVVVGRRAKRPALVHALWIVVLLELLVPPLFEVGILPRSALLGAGEGGSGPAAAIPVASPGVGNPHVAATGASGESPAAMPLVRSLPIALGAVWAMGTLGVLLLAAVRMRRFGRLLEHATAPPAEMRATAERLATRLGLKRCPRIRLVPASISPMLRPRLGSLEVLFPSTLLARLRRRERDSLVAHELAHVRRGDHWVRLIELVAVAVFWWHPVVWCARGRLRRAEEQCCDGLVLDTLPDHARDYARGLVKTLEHLAVARPGLPSLASGIGGAGILEERLTMIMKRRPPKRLSHAQRVALAVAAGALLIVIPTWADRADERDENLRQQEEQLVQAEAEIREGVRALELQALELEKQLQAVRERQRELEMQLAHERGELTILHLEAEANAVEAAGQAEAAERMRREQEHLRRQVDLEISRGRVEADLRREVVAQEAELRRLALEAEESAARGDHEEVKRIQLEATERRIVLEDATQRTRRQQVELEERQRDLVVERLHAELAAAAKAGRRDAARAIERELARLERGERQIVVRKREHEAQREYDTVRMYEAQREYETKLREMDRHLGEMALKLEQMEADGRPDQAAELKRQIEKLQEAIDDVERPEVD
jgi:beta-lactamase regulating signal transducer with metallopeptidase domain